MDVRPPQLDLHIGPQLITNFKTNRKLIGVAKNIICHILKYNIDGLLSKCPKTQK